MFTSVFSVYIPLLSLNTALFTTEPVIIMGNIILLSLSP